MSKEKHKDIWIFQTGEPIFTDGDNRRPMRAMNLAKTLEKLGHKVTIWTAGFYHQEKKHRYTTYHVTDYTDRIQIRFIPSPGYIKNISFARFWDHLILAIRLKRILSNEKKLPDVVFVGYPPIEFAYVAIIWANKKNIPSIIDVKDQWPSIFIENFPKYLSWFGYLIFYPYFYIAKKTIKSATRLCSMSNSYINWMANFSKRNLNNSEIVAPLTSIVENNNLYEMHQANEWWKINGVENDNRIKFVFIGSLSQSFDFNSIVEFSKKLILNNSDWQIIICGNGDKNQELKEKFKSLENVIIPGWIDRTKILALAQMLAFGLAPYKNIRNFKDNIPNKIIDYLSMGMPIISPLNGEVKDLIVNYNLGIFYDENIFDALPLDIFKKLSEMNRNCINFYKLHFDGDKVYMNLAHDLISTEL